ncbi:GNAT family N-acetyltransferase [Methanonatronarchaeum sp. AMET-Sl]|uniref:GNAT family N-acetyltransferase n=1 Tax=Methanonatronarchaeum sp. AMET-Sl TaxID=3037654 RepID=UPI00244DCFDD|nr:GNAT family N-acetyltransferase [Methanonatronarchaeum sp. AMET-Sl]WGI17113.1 GNAT family N-acetyltransferase [Methanonatronarchaeum sp. AMET-Sl]
MTNNKNRRIKIREAVPNDAEETAPLILNAFDTERELLGKNHEERIKTLKKLFKKTKNRVTYQDTYIAEINNETAGVLISFQGDKLSQKNRYTFLHLILTKNPIQLIRTIYIYLKQISQMASFEETKKDEMYIACLSVHPKHRRKGIAEKLLKHHEKTAKQKGYKKSSLCVHGKNHPAINLYHKKGYKEKNKIQADGIKIIKMTKNIKNQ